MSDSFIAILGMGFLAGASVTLIIIGAIYGSDKRQHDIDLDMRIYVPHRNRDRGCDKRNDKQLEAEKEIKERAEKLGVKIGE